MLNIIESLSLFINNNKQKLKKESDGQFPKVMSSSVRIVRHCSVCCELCYLKRRRADISGNVLVSTQLADKLRSLEKRGTFRRETKY